MDEPDPLKTAVKVHAPAFLTEIWMSVRPYLQCFLKDWVIAVCFYLLQKLFEWIMNLAPFDGWLGVFITKEHEAGTLLAFALFNGLLIRDVIRLAMAERERVS